MAPLNFILFHIISYLCDGASPPDIKNMYNMSTSCPGSILAKAHNIEAPLPERGHGANWCQTSHGMVLC